MSTSDVAAFVRAQLADATTQWNLGSFGVVAEFMRDADEPADMRTDGLAVATARGAIGFSSLKGVRPFASETAGPTGWNHRVALCLPAADARMSRRRALTELGPDADALRAIDRGAVLFDLGLGCFQVDACIRTADAALVDLLRTHAGRPLMAAGNPAMGAILDAGPHRVFIARMARCEVYQPIPAADGRSPAGPHTHVLPKLLAHGRTHAANEPAPDGLIPCVKAVPAHPAKDAMGRPRLWNEPAHIAFQALLERFGDRDAMAVKRRPAGADEDSDGEAGAGRWRRMAAKVARMQAAARGR